LFFLLDVDGGIFSHLDLFLEFLDLFLEILDLFVKIINCLLFGFVLVGFLEPLLELPDLLNEFIDLLFQCLSRLILL
jgi:hypothetical protein